MSLSCFSKTVILNVLKVIIYISIYPILPYKLYCVYYINSIKKKIKLAEKNIIIFYIRIKQKSFSQILLKTKREFIEIIHLLSEQYENFKIKNSTTIQNTIQYIYFS